MATANVAPHTSRNASQTRHEFAMETAMGDMDELVKEFLAESGENLDRLDQDFVALEKEGYADATDRLASIFRTIHTIKGTCGFLGFDKLQSVTHVGENLLSKLREGKLAVTTEIISALLKLVDAVREILGSIEGKGNEGNGNYDQLIAVLELLNEGVPAAIPESIEIAPPIPEPQTAIHEEPLLEEDHSIAESESKKRADVSSTDKETVTLSAASSGIRVDVSLLDKLMNLVGELVLARNQILQFSVATENPTLASSTQRLNLITTELQEGVMKTRMQPIGNVWGKFPRIVRDLSQLCGKKVRVEMEGRATELDKTIIEAIKDPLTHIIRNSVDHGIESPEKRLAANKPEEGRLFLRAFHEGGQVNIEIIDDGGGIPVDRVKKKAVERGLITVEQSARMSDREAVNLIFLPGFSTAETITNVSGRGVGMDVVKTNIEKIGGSVDVQSRPGQGTTLRIRIPLTLAIIPALIITSGGDRYAIPQVSLLELVRLEEEQARRGIETIRGVPVYRLRGNLLPLVYLNKQLQTGADSSHEHRAINIVVLQADERQFGLVVDEINDTEEIVVKPLGKSFKGLTTFAGATIMGDGRVALILDVMGVAQRANVISQGKDHGVHEPGRERSNDASARQTLLLFQACHRRRMAIPLSLVARLEEFPNDVIEYSGDQMVVQYRGQIMPLVSLSKWLSGDTFDSNAAIVGAKDNVQVIVYTDGERCAGVIVDRIVDIVEQAVSVQRTGTRTGVLGSAIIDNKVCELLDVEGVIRQVLPDWAAESTTPSMISNKAA